MSKRLIVRIDEEECDGCGQCVLACAEEALQIVDGKARLVSEVYCDGLGACLGECPRGALTIEEREAAAFDEEAARSHAEKKAKREPLPCGCPGSAIKTLKRHGSPACESGTAPVSGLSHWPVQLALVTPGAPFLCEADILVCADCVPFAVPDLHSRYLAGRAVLVGCPKLDDRAHYREKLEAIFKQTNPRGITVLRMEVPCCGAMAHVVAAAREKAALDCPLDIEVVGIEDGRATPQAVGSETDAGVTA